MSGQPDRQELDRILKIFGASPAPMITGEGIFVRSDPHLAFDLFSELSLGDHKHFLDIGCGDGIIVAIASLFTDASGIELDPVLLEKAKKYRMHTRLKYDLQKGDALELDLSRFDFIYIYVDRPIYKLEKKMIETFKGTLLVVGQLHIPLLLKPVWQKKIGVLQFNLYKLQ